MASEAKLTGLLPDNCRVRSARILLENLEVPADIGFHDFEVGNPQRLLVTVEIWLDHLDPPPDDDPLHAWDYDYLRKQVQELARARRYNLQETFAHAVFERIGALHGIRALRVRTSKPDVYAEAQGVGVEIASFSGLWPNE